MFNKFYKIIIIIIVFFIFILYNYARKKNSNSWLKEDVKNESPRNVFFDLGTNNGDSVKFFIDKTMRTENESFLKGYGGANNKKWEIYAVEANPYFDKTLDDLKLNCEKLGHIFHLFKQTAAWTKNEKLVFYLDTVNFYNNFWGSSLLKNHPDVANSGYKNVTVNGIDIAELLRKYNKEDEIVLKIDIEGTEYPLLMHLIKEHVLDLVDIIAVEYHRHIVKDIPIKEMEDFYVAYFKFMEIRTVPWY